jgi:undecaprenyl pyrophosphate phosphatase UppP
MVKIGEVKLSIATAVAAAFGFVIALLWRDIIIGLLKLAGLWQEGGFNDYTGAIVGIIVAIIITIICVLGIMYISKWGGITKK